MKEYLLAKGQSRLKKMSRVYLVMRGGLEAIGRFCQHNTFLIVLLRHSETQGLVSAFDADLSTEAAVVSSDVQLCFTFRKGVSAVASLLKSYGLEKDAVENKKRR